MSFQKKIAYLAMILSMLFLAACGAQGNGVPVTGATPTAGVSPGTPGLPAKAVLAAQQWLATQLSVAADQVRIIEAEQTEWTDSCLGLGRANESCLQVMTPGWRVVLEANGQRYEARTNEDGSVIRVASPTGFPTGLENTQWSLVSFGAPGADQPLVEGSAITLMLAGGKVGGSGGCNSYGGTYQVDGNNITFGEIIHTERACADQTMTEQEQRYFQALQSAREYQVNGDQLEITYDNGVMTFEPAQASVPTEPTATPGG
jgi:heat shock protein HslJ